MPTGIENWAAIGQLRKTTIFKSHITGSINCFNINFSEVAFEMTSQWWPFEMIKQRTKLTSTFRMVKNGNLKIEWNVAWFSDFFRNIQGISFTCMIAYGICHMIFCREVYCLISHSGTFVNDEIADSFVVQ